MELQHSFQVPGGVNEAWDVLLDVERLGPCMPGATIDSVAGDDFTATVKVKLGPMGLTYKGRASFVEKDVAAHRLVINARGRDTRGNGTANATVTAVLTGDESNTDVSVTTDLDVTGKPAQFGRSVLADVSEKLIGQFADSLARTLEPEQPEAQGEDNGSPAPLRKASKEKHLNDSVDLGHTVLPVLVQRVAPFALMAVLVIALLRFFRKSL